MNYDEARPLADGAGWHWTTMNDGVVRAAASCVGEEAHSTREKAERHFYEYSLSLVQDGQIDWTGCEVEGCDTPTKTTLGNAGMYLFFQRTALCEAHDSREFLQQVYPFATGLQMVHS